MNIKGFLKEIESYVPRTLLAIDVVLYLIALIMTLGFPWSHIGGIVISISLCAFVIVSLIIIVHIINKRNVDRKREETNALGD